MPTDEVNWREREELWMLRGEVRGHRNFIDYVKEHHPDVARAAALYALKKVVENDEPLEEPLEPMANHMASEFCEEREEYKQVIGWARGLTELVTKVVNKGLTDDPDEIVNVIVEPPALRLLGYYAATLNKWMERLTKEEPK